MTTGGVSDKQAGFTLLEVLIVLAITAVVFGLSFASLSILRNRASPDKLGMQIARLLNDVRERATTLARPEMAIIDMKSKIVSSSFDDPIELPASFKLVVTVGREIVSDKEQLQVQFLPDGTSSGVDIVLSDTKGQSSRIETNWLTGLTRQVPPNG